MKLILKHLKSILGLALTASVLLLMHFANPVQVQADSSAENSSDDTPIVMVGDSLTSSQEKETIQVLTKSLNGADYKVNKVTGSDLVKYLNPSGNNFTTSSGVWSSAMIQKEPSGSGIDVTLLDFNGKNNITSITAEQYRNAAITAGLSDAHIYVTSAVPIDGSGALAGVYASYAQNHQLNQKQVNAAQDEMESLNKISNENKDKDGYSDAQLNRAVAGAKSEMAKQGQNISDSQIRDIVNNQIKINHLGNTINNNQKEQIINILTNVKNSGALKNGNFKEQAAKLSTSLTGDAKKVWEKVNTPENRNWLENIWNQIVAFVNNIFNRNN